MLRSKKIACFILASVMVLTIFSGCTKKVDNGEYKLVWYTFGTKQPDHDKVMAAANKLIKEKLGFEVEMNVIDSGSYEQKINLAISAGETFDLCFTSNWLNNFNNNAAKGAFAEITPEMLANDAPGLKEKYPDYFFDGGLYNGKIYAIPNYQLNAIPEGMSIRKEFADKYNFDISKVKELKDIEPLLEAIKQNEPGVYGIEPTGYDPYSAKYDNVGFERQLMVAKDDPTHTVVARCDTPYAKQVLEFWSDWYDKGYIRKDLATYKDTEIDIKNNKYGVLTGGIKPGGDSDLKLKTNKDYVPVILGEPQIKSSVTVVTMLGISRTSKNPDNVLKFINLLHTDKDIYNMLLFGLEGEHYKVVSENPKVVEVPVDTKYSMSETSAWAMGNQFNAWYRTDQKVGIWDESEKLNRESKKSEYYGFTFDNSSVKTEVAQVAAVFNEYDDTKLYSVDNWREKYDTYVQKVHTAGVDKMVAELQKQLNDWFAKKAQ